MADKTELSLQSLYSMLSSKADKNHTHYFMGNIESALSLNGVTYDKFVRNDIKDQTIKAYYDDVSLGLASNNTSLRLHSGDNLAQIIVNNDNLSSSNLIVSGDNNKDITMKVIGKLVVNDSRVLTLNNKNEISGVDLSDLDIAGKGIIVNPSEPANSTDGMIWGEELENNLVDDSTSTSGTQVLYTIPIGSIIKTLSTTIPNGYLEANGSLVSRSGYTGLWNFIKAKAVVVTDAIWQSEYAKNNNIGKYSYGDGALTFRLPNIPTGDSTKYLIKAYDDLSINESLNLQDIKNDITSLQNSRVSSGVGFVKFEDGGLIQYGIANNNKCSFSLQFINSDYSIIPNYEGVLTNVDVTIDSNNKLVSSCSFKVTDNNGLSITNAVIDYIAIGRWK